VVVPDSLLGDGGNGGVDEAARRRLLDDLRAEGWDLAIQLHGGGRNSNPIVAALDARLAVGARTPDALPLDLTIPYVYWQHEIHRGLEIVGLLGVPPVTLQPRVDVTFADVAGARRVLDLGDGDALPPFAVLHPGATDLRRRWPAASFAAVGDELAVRGYRVVVTGTAAEADTTAAVVGAMSRPADDLAGRLDLSALVGLLASSAVVVSNDTGPLHLADAVGALSVGIFWAGNLINAAPPFRARHRPLPSWRLECPECGVDCTCGTCSHRSSFVADVAVGSVVEAALELLEHQGRSN
jgi:ADP-heptose:LPS heptosyltransferase